MQFCDLVYQLKRFSNQSFTFGFNLKNSLKTCCTGDYFELSRINFIKFANTVSHTMLWAKYDQDIAR